MLILITPLANLFALFSTIIGTLFLLFSLFIVFDPTLPNVEKSLFFLFSLLVLGSGYLLPVIKESLGAYFEQDPNKKVNEKKLNL